MSITGDRYEGTFDGHKIELVRNNLSKTLNLLIDGAVVASEHRWLPKDITLHADFEHEGVKHVVVAHQHSSPSSACQSTPMTASKSTASRYP